MVNKDYFRLNGIPVDEKELKQRLNDFDGIVVHHERFKELLDVVRESHVLERGVVILGDTGAGKSTLFKLYESYFPRQTKTRIRNNHEEKYTRIPVLRVELDSNSKPLNVASKMLEMLGDELHYKGTEKVLTSRLKKYLLDAEVELIIIDELQHMIDTDTHRVIRKAADWLKQLLNDVQLPIIFGGIKEDAKRIFTSNKQLDERFPHKCWFYGFRYENDDEQKEFRGFLKSISNQLPLANHSHIYDPNLAEKIYYVTLGIPRTLNHLLHHSVKYALKNGNDMLDEHHLEHGFGKLSFETRPRVINPFHGKTFDFKIALEKEKGKAKESENKGA